MRILNLLRARAPRRWLVALLVVVIIFGLTVWFGPFRAPPPSFVLLALDASGRFTATADMMGMQADTLPENSAGLPRLPFVLAMQNVGGRPGRPRVLDLYLPSFLVLYDAQGNPIDRQREGGNPLVHYQFELPRDPVEPGGLPVVLPGRERMWLEPALAQFVCVIGVDGVPEFRPAPDYDPQLLSQVRIFYSLSEGGRARSTGLLSLRLAPELLNTSPAPEPPLFPTITRSDATLPDTTLLVRVGTRAASCGELDVPLTVHSTSFRTPGGGRVLAVQFEGRSRKWLFDLEGDSLIDAEVWDPDGDGTFDAGRRARFPIPPFLLPYRKRVVVPDTVPVDSVWLLLFHDTAAGPLRFLPPERRPRPDTGALPRDSTRDTTRVDTTAARQ
jgi:hypothetical protein